MWLSANRLSIRQSLVVHGAHGVSPGSAAARTLTDGRPLDCVGSRSASSWTSPCSHELGSVNVYTPVLLFCRYAFPNAPRPVFRTEGPAIGRIGLPGRGTAWPELSYLNP